MSTCMATATDEGGRPVRLAKSRRRAAQNRLAFENDGDLDTYRQQIR